MVNVRRPAAQDGACETPGLWRWDHVEFRVLHPGPWLPYMGNDSSCVISVRAKRQSLLLAGDVSSAVEQRLLAQGLMPHDVLLVPHHGSASSSSLPFIRALQPRRAIATASLGNRFGFPRPAVRRRYEEAGAQFWSTGSCGAIRFRYGPGGRLEAESARRVRKRIWRWPAAANCP
jgi:competence protein ComEC